MLEIKNIKKTYHMSNHDVNALKGVSFNVKQGNLVAIVGQSGCGKTSLMNIIGALDSDFSGDVVINGKSLKDAHNKDLDTYRKNTIGFIFQHFTLINSLNTFENVALAYDISSLNKKEKIEKTNKLLESVGLLEHAKKKVNVLSGGQKQRVAIARALANNPDIILADEPTGALDHKTGIQVMELLKEVAKDRIVIMVTHSPELAKEYANVIVSMQDGEVVDISDNILSEDNNKVIEDNNSKSNMGILTAMKLAYRNLKLKKGRTIWTSIGMSIGIVGIALALALSNGTKQTIENQVMSIFPANTISVQAKTKSTKPISLDYSDYNNIKEIAKDANGTLFFPENIMPTIGSFDKKSADINLVRKNANKKSEHNTIMLANVTSFNSYTGKVGFGRKPDMNKPYEAVLSLSTVENLISDGQKVEDVLNKNLHVSFIDIDTNKAEIVTLKIVGISSENTLFDTMYITNTFANEMLSTYFKVDYKDIRARNVFVFKNDVNNIKEYVNKLNSKTDDYKFESVAESVLGTVNVILDAVRNGLIAFSSVSVFVAILMISIVVYISVLERKQEIGIIRAIGGKTKDIRNMFLSESLTIGLLAGTIGVGVAYGICFGINAIVQALMSSISKNMPPFNVANLDFTTAIILIVICGFLSVISGMIPSIKAARLDPIDAIRKK